MCLKQLLSLTSKCHFFNRCKFEFLFGEGSGRCAAVNYIYIPLNCFQERSLNSNVHGNRFDRASRLDGLNAPPDRTVCCSSPFHWRLLHVSPKRFITISAVALSQRSFGLATDGSASATNSPSACISFNIIQYYFESVFVLKRFGPIDVRGFTTSNCTLFALDLFL